MTLDVTLFRETKAFIKPTPQALYPVRIPLQHYQLRHFISAVEDGRIYYASRDEVCALHLATGKRERMAALPFTAQCLGAGFGWVCVGGQTGRCIFIDVSDRDTPVDELLPLNLDPHARPGDEPQDLAGYRLIRPRAFPHTVSSDYINSIALFRIASEEKGLDDEEVALVSTNDHSVEIFSLRQLKVINTLTFPVNMNHASISPDGKLMIACGDAPRAYFLRRVLQPGAALDGRHAYAKYEWKEFANVRLTATEPRDTCFSTAFSPSGHVCTVSSQFGVVTVFDVSRIYEGMDNDDAVIDSFTSSRPAPIEEIGAWMPGAVRSSAFSPEPWDLFAWAEDRGRVCIADLRDGFRTRQLIELDPSSPELERWEITDAEDQSIAELRELDIQASILRRQREAAQEQLAALSNGADYVESAAERRRRQQRELAGNVWAANTAADLTETERQILETLRVERLQDAANADDRAYSVHYAGAPASRGYNPNISVRQYIRERSSATNNQSTSSRSHGPRRRSSVVISSTRNQQGESSSSTVAPAASSSSAHPSSLLPITGSSNLSASPSRLATATSAQSSARSSGQSSPEPTPLTSTADQAWRTISAAMINASAIPSTEPPSDNDRRARVREVLRLLLLEDQQNLDRRQQAQQRDLETARAQLAQPERHGNVSAQSSSNTAPPPFTTLPTPPTPAPAPASAPASALAPDLSSSNTPAAPAPLDDVDARTALRIQRERTRRQQVEQLLAEYRALQRQGLEAAESRDGWSSRADRSDSGSGNALAEGSGGGGGGSGALNQVRHQQLRRLQERAQLAEERLPGVAAAAAAAAAVEGGGAATGMAYLREAGEIGSGLTALSTRREREQGVAVMGLGWSTDGRTLFVGTEDGIFLYQLDAHSRKCFPAVYPR